MKLRILFATMFILFMCSFMPVHAMENKAEPANEVTSVVDKVKKAKIRVVKPSKVQFTDKCASKAESVTLHWMQSEYADGYVIYRSTKKNSKFTEVKRIQKAQTLKWTNKELDDETAYFYKVRPYNKEDGKIAYGEYSKVYEKEMIPKSIEQVQKYTYVNYVSGGESPSGWDCSGFTQWFYKKYYGKTLPRSSREQAKVGKSINKNNMSKWQPGDILVYSSGGRVNHVGLYLGSGKMMHALNRKYDTVIQNVEDYEAWDSRNNLKDVRRCL